MHKHARVPPALARATVPGPVREVLRVLDAAGHRSWLVGGAVRDLLLHRGGRTAADLDVATPATPQEVTELFPRVIPTGIEHGTVTVLVGGEGVEVTTFRGEGAYLDGRRPSSVTFLGSLEEDLARRDFTMNALAWDPIAGEFRDPFRGRDDIRRRIIRAVGDPAERFREDGLRPLRGVRFAAQLGYRIELRTLRAIPGALEVVRLVSAERVAEELTRLLSARRPAVALRLLDRTGLLGVVVPALGRLSPQARAHAVEVASGAPERPPALRLAALLHQLEPLDAEQAIVALRLPNRLALEVLALLSERRCLAGRGAYAWPRAAVEVRRWLARLGVERAKPLLALWEADARRLPLAARRREQAALRRLRSAVTRSLAGRPPLTLGDLAIDGRRVMQITGASPGRAVGEALRHLLDRVLADPGRNEPALLEEEVRSWWSGREEPGPSA
jgi:tRNA nucleotidyltransferase (CCA-adding enzyme)